MSSAMARIADARTERHRVLAKAMVISVPAASEEWLSYCSRKATEYTAMQSGAGE